MVWLKNEDEARKYLNKRFDNGNIERPSLGKITFDENSKTWEAEFHLTTRDIITGGKVMFTDDRKRIDHCLFNHKIRVKLEGNESNEIQKLYSDNWEFIRDEVKRLNGESQ